MTNIKNSAVDLTELAIGVVVLGVVVSVGAVILVGVRDSQLTGTTTVTTVNESVATLGHTATALSEQYFRSIVSVINSTGFETIGATNYTITTDGGVGSIAFSGAAGSLYNQTAVDVTYTRYNVSNPQYNLPDEAAIGLGEFGNWFKILVIVGIAAVVLSLIFLAFGRGGSATNGNTGGVNF